MTNPWESFFAATSVLVSSRPIKHRLSEAYRMHLAGIDQNDLPNEIREEFSSLSTRMSRVRPSSRGESAVDATVRKMSDADAGRAAARIVNMLGVIARLQTQQRAPTLRVVGDD